MLHSSFKVKVISGKNCLRQSVGLTSATVIEEQTRYGVNFFSLSLSLSVCLSVSLYACVCVFSVSESRNKITQNRHRRLEVETMQTAWKILTIERSLHRLVFRSVRPLTLYLFTCHHIRRDHPRCTSARQLSSTCMRPAANRHTRSATAFLGHLAVWLSLNVL